MANPKPTPEAVAAAKEIYREQPSIIKDSGLSEEQIRMLLQPFFSRAINKAVEAADKLAELLQPMIPQDIDAKDAWWCPSCVARVTATFTEHCCHCGCFLTDVQPNDHWIIEARAVLREYEESKK